jgi:hypothetical protein
MENDCNEWRKREPAVMRRVALTASGHLRPIPVSKKENRTELPRRNKQQSPHIEDVSSGTSRLKPFKSGIARRGEDFCEKGGFSQPERQKDGIKSPKMVRRRGKLGSTALGP